MPGKMRRMARVLQGPSRRCLILPMDHGPWIGPVKGIDRPLEITRQAMRGGASALLIGPGFARLVMEEMRPETALILRVSITPGLAPEATQESPVATLETALRLDADAVAASIFFGRGGEVAMMRYMGTLAEECGRYGMPLLAEMIPPADTMYQPEAIAHAARIGWELGADLVKTTYCGEPEAFRDVVRSTPIPIVVAGGPAKDEREEDLLNSVRAMVEAGAAGIAFGRRVWGAPDPEALIAKLHAVIFAD